MIKSADIKETRLSIGLELSKELDIDIDFYSCKCETAILSVSFPHFLPYMW